MLSSELPSNLPPSLSRDFQKESLEKALDDLLEQYLLLLDQYQTLQRGISSNFAAGFISLAQANFSNSNRLRYGQDFYDDRMQASTLISIDPVPSPSEYDIEFAENRRSPSKNEADATKAALPTNPLKWFGFFAPPALQKCQREFKDATSSIPAIATVRNRMRELEIEVRRTRKKLSKLS